MDFQKTTVKLKLKGNYVMRFTKSIEIKSI